MALAVAILVMSIGATSSDQLQLVLGLIFGTVDSVIYTHVTNKDILGIALILTTCFIMILWHTSERYTRHIIKRQRFFEFGNL